MAWADEGQEVDGRFEDEAANDFTQDKQDEVNIGITFTGADERTAIADLVDLQRMGAEVGILYTFSPDGRQRYPSRDWIFKTLSRLNGQSAIHVCGERARQQLYDGSIADLVGMARRVQVNGHLQPAWLARVCDQYRDKTIITQHTNKNLWLLPVGAPNHAVLVDGSGGRGITPVAWEKPNTDKPIGFAGGIGPKTISDALSQILEVIDGHPNGWWIDMENAIRENDWFSVPLAKDVLEYWLDWKDGMS